MIYRKTLFDPNEQDLISFFADCGISVTREQAAGWLTFFETVRETGRPYTHVESLPNGKSCRLFFSLCHLMLTVGESSAVSEHFLIKENIG